MRLIDIVNKYPDENWCWFDLSKNPSITFDDVLKYQAEGSLDPEVSQPKVVDKSWNWYALSRNPSITFEDVLTNQAEGSLDPKVSQPKVADKPWNLYRLVMNPNITFDHVLAYPDKPWNWCWLSLKVIKFPQQRIEYLDLLSKI